METIIRNYTKFDYSTCLFIFRSNVPKYFTVEEFNEFEAFLKKLENGQDVVEYYVIVHNQRVVACGGFGDKDNNGVYSFAWGMVHRDFHKKGFGTLLFKHRISELRKINPSHPIVLDTTQHSSKFFEKMGFRLTGITENYYTQGMHRYDMVYELEKEELSAFET